MRRVYVDRPMTAEFVEAMKAQFGEVEFVNLYAMPNDTDEQRNDRLRAWAQAISEGTAETTRERIKALELEMKAAGLLDRKTVNRTLTLTLDGATVLELLKWGPSRHALSQTTVVDAKKETP